MDKRDNAKWFYSVDNREYKSHIKFNKINDLSSFIDDFEIEGTQVEYEKKALDEMDE